MLKSYLMRIGFIPPVDRIYCALFYASIPLLHTRGLSSSKHSGVRSLFNEQFVKPGQVDAELGRFYSRMFEFRQKSDYADFVEFEKEKVREWFEKAKQFIREIDRIIAETQ